MMVLVSGWLSSYPPFGGFIIFSPSLPSCPKATGKCSRLLFRLLVNSFMMSDIGKEIEAANLSHNDYSTEGLIRVLSYVRQVLAILYHHRSDQISDYSEAKLERLHRENELLRDKLSELERMIKEVC